MDEDSTIGIIGSGSWATAIAKMVLNNSDKLNWYFREKDQGRDGSIFKGLVRFRSDQDKKVLSFFYLPWGITWGR